MTIEKAQRSPKVTILHFKMVRARLLGLTELFSSASTLQMSLTKGSDLARFPQQQFPEMVSEWQKVGRGREDMAAWIRQEDKHPCIPISFGLASASSETWAILLKATDGLRTCETAMVLSSVWER